MSDVIDYHKFMLQDHMERFCCGSQLGVSKNNGTPKSSILIGFSIINHPFWGTTIFGNTQLNLILVVKNSWLLWSLEELEHLIDEYENLPSGSREVGTSKTWKNPVV